MSDPLNINVNPVPGDANFVGPLRENAGVSNNEAEPVVPTAESEQVLPKTVEREAGSYKPGDAFDLEGDASTPVAKGVDPAKLEKKIRVLHGDDDGVETLAGDEPINERAGLITRLKSPRVFVPVGSGLTLTAILGMLFSDPLIDGLRAIPGMDRILPVAELKIDSKTTIGPARSLEHQFYENVVPDGFFAKDVQIGFDALKSQVSRLKELEKNGAINPETGSEIWKLKSSINAARAEAFRDYPTYYNFKSLTDPKFRKACKEVAARLGIDPNKFLVEPKFGIIPAQASRLGTLVSPETGEIILEAFTHAGFTEHAFAMQKNYRTPTDGFADYRIQISVDNPHYGDLNFNSLVKDGETIRSLIDSANKSYPQSELRDTQILAEFQHKGTNYFVIKPNANNAAFAQSLLVYASAETPGRFNSLKPENIFRGPLTKTLVSGGSKEVKKALEFGLAGEDPITVLVDRGNSSASILVSGGDKYTPAHISKVGDYMASLEPGTKVESNEILAQKRADLAKVAEAQFTINRSFLSPMPANTSLIVESVDETAEARNLNCSIVYNKDQKIPFTILGLDDENIEHPAATPIKGLSFNGHVLEAYSPKKKRTLSDNLEEFLGAVSTAIEPKEVYNRQTGKWGPQAQRIAFIGRVPQENSADRYYFLTTGGHHKNRRLFQGSLRGLFKEDIYRRGNDRVYTNGLGKALHFHPKKKVWRYKDRDGGEYKLLEPLFISKELDLNAPLPKKTGD